MEKWMLKRCFDEYLAEDLGFGDLTTRLCVDDRRVEALVEAKDEFVLSGTREITLLFESYGVEAKGNFTSGSRVKKGDILLELKGPASAILGIERTALNIMMRMCGIATKVRRFKELAGDTVIACTRKTTPGFRYFEKRAVEDGGGDPHRRSLDDMVLIKENHITLSGGLENAIKRAKKASFSKKIDVEVTDVLSAVKAAKLGVDIIMLDNMTPSSVKEAYEKIKDIDKSIIVEVSGGMDESNVSDYAPYADVISSGALTHSVNSADISLLIITRKG
ncbi:MAG: carboxylating nicotinate-nucleotide diphosphorylase [Thermoplasmata archaeon]